MEEPVVPSPKRSVFAKIFFSHDEPRLRAGWRLLVQTLVMVALSIPLSVVIYLATVSLGADWQFLFAEIAELIIVTASIFLARRFLDRCSVASLGLKLDRAAPIDIVVGIGITFVMMGFIYTIEQSAGWLKFEGFAWQLDPISMVLSNTLMMLGVFVLVGWSEELLSRGYHLQTIASGINLFWGVILSSAVFGLLHLGNPNATWVSAAGIFFAGVFLAYAYLRTGQLWLSIGLHIGWNFFEGMVFGFPVSGLDIYPLTRIQVQGPELWTGGAFGPEAGLVILPAMLLGAGLIFLYTRNRDHGAGAIRYR